MSTQSPELEDTRLVLTSGTLADRLGGALIGRADITVTGVNSLADATSDDVSFVRSDKHLKYWQASTAGTTLVSRSVAINHQDVTDTGRAVIMVDDAEQAMIDVLEVFYQDRDRPQSGVHSSAVIHPSATLGQDVAIGPLVVINADVQVGSETTIHAGVRLERGAKVGRQCVLHSHVVVGEQCEVRNHVMLHTGVAIGTDGFGYRPNADGSALRKMPHLGNVVIHDHVEIGANSCIDRGKFGATVIGVGTKIDNLVQVGHNCSIGQHTVIAALTGIGGSATIGSFVQIGGSVGIADQTIIHDRVTIMAMSGVMGEIAEGETIWGSPAQGFREESRQVVLLRGLREWQRSVEERIGRSERAASEISDT